MEKSNTGRSRSSSRGSSPGRSPVYHHDHGSRAALVDEHVHGFKVNIRPEKKSKFSSIVLKLRGIEEVKYCSLNVAYVSISLSLILVASFLWNSFTYHSSGPSQHIYVPMRSYASLFPM